MFSTKWTDIIVVSSKYNQKYTHLHALSHIIANTTHTHIQKLCSESTGEDDAGQLIDFSLGETISSSNSTTDPSVNFNNNRLLLGSGGVVGGGAVGDALNLVNTNDRHEQQGTSVE